MDADVADEVAGRADSGGPRPDVVRVACLLGARRGSVRVAAAAAEVVTGVEERGGDVDEIWLDDLDLPPADLITDRAAVESLHARLDACAAVVVVSPLLRSDVPARVKAALDLLPATTYEPPSGSLAGKAVGVVLVGASWHHYLAIERLGGLLSGVFGAWVVPPGIYVEPASAERPEVRERLRLVGRQVVVMARCIRDHPELGDVSFTP